MSTPFPQAPVPARKAGGINPWILGCVVVPGALMICFGFAAVLGWRELVSYGVASDFTEYEAKIRPMELDPEVKRPLLARMEKLRDKSRTSSVSFWRWVEYDGAIKPMLADDKLTPDEVEALNHELDRMEAEFR